MSNTHGIGIGTETKKKKVLKKNSNGLIHLRNSKKMKWGHIDFDFEYRAFCEKVRGSPEVYQDHQDLRLAFQAQLRNAKPKQNVKSSSITRTNEISIYAKSTVLRELPTEVKASHNRQFTICSIRYAKLYQIPGRTKLNAVLLSDWILETYRPKLWNDPARSIEARDGRKRRGRLTPDVITEWMGFEIEQETIKRGTRDPQRQTSRGTDREGWTDQRFERSWKQSTRPCDLSAAAHH